MADAISATPLLALDAVALDTETTSLDPAKARVIEIGCILLSAGRVDANAKFHVLVDPGEPIPPASTAIHGIDAVKLKGANNFAAVWPELQNFIGNRPLIGHTTHYDLTILANECKRAGLKFAWPRSVDIRVLAEIVKPGLSGFSIEHLAAWLSVEVKGRHSALGDAETTAEIFERLVPHLREGGIRTFAEAETACRQMTEAYAAQHRAGWIEPLATPAQSDSERTLARIDSYPYRHRTREVMSAPPHFIAGSAKLSEAMQMLMEKKVSSLYVADTSKGAPLAADTGIVTERDVLRAIAAGGAAALDQNVDVIASRPLAAVPAESFVYRAIGRMNRMKIRHLGVIDAAGRVIGALSARDLLRLRAGDAISLGDEIDEAQDARALGRAWAKLPAVAKSLLTEGIDARTIAAIISRELGALTRQAAVIAEARMKQAGKGKPPVSYAVLILGSGGRGESLLAMDQDNAIVFAKGEPDGPEDKWFAELGMHLADILHEVGVPYCKGGVMAKNPPWRGSAKTWRERIAHWISRSSPEDLLSVDIFFDFRAVHGDGALALQLWHDAYGMAKGEIGFLKLLAEAAGPAEPPVGLFGIKTNNGRVDLKKGGLFTIVAAARVLAMRFHVAEHSTKVRLESVKAKKIGAERDLDMMVAAHAVLLENILDQQLVDIAAGRAPSNAVEIRRLGKPRQEELRKALSGLSSVDEMVRDLLSAR